MPDFQYIKMGTLGFTLEPTFPTPYEFLLYYAPKQNWDCMKDISWEEAKNTPGVMDLLTDVKMRSLVTPPLFINDPNRLI